MQMRVLFFCGILPLLCLTPVLADEKPVPKKPAALLTERDLPDNVQVRLVAARRSEERTVHLIAKFVTTDKEKREILVVFHTTVATPHERTLMSLVEACVGGCGPGAGPAWRPAEAEAVFSIPKEGVTFHVRNRQGYDKCYLVSLKLKKGE
jgi:hypothetical protein